LWSSILLAPLDVSRKMMSDPGHYSKNAPWHLPPISIEIAQHL
jgi:hypothetical protein